MDNTKDIVETDLYRVKLWYYAAREACRLRRILHREEYEKIENDFRPELEDILKQLSDLQYKLEIKLKADDYGKEDFDMIFDNETGVYSLDVPTTWERPASCFKA
jgi:hypothetical protein